jgi:tetratricopeptide (TPR) repeat protein
VPRLDFGFATSWLSTLLSRDRDVSRSPMLDRMRPETPPTLPPGTEIAGYVLEERIGAGGFGEVYRARHPTLERVAAIKVLHARYSHDVEALARFADEARAVNRINHPGIVDIYELGRAHDREYYVMELIAGRSLRAILDERGKLPLAEALPLLRGIAEAVDAAHAAGIAHRDLKPDNVFVVGSTPKLIDFGLAKLVADGAITETGSVFGTPLYMSPEQCRGRGVDTRTDLYSFGVLAYHVLTGAPPFGGDPLELALHHVNDPPPAPKVSRTVDRVLLALLAKDPAARPAKLADAVAALEGSAKLRVRRLRPRHLLALLPLAAAGIAIAAWPRGETACPSKLDAFWPAQRARLVAKFSGPALARVTAQLDAVAAQWNARWQAACHADRETDPLLYGQRIACLENARLDFEGDATHVATYDAATLEELLVEGLGTGRSLTDCDNPAVLRAQVPPPPAAVRAQVVAKRLDVWQAIEDGWLAARQRDRAAIDRAAAKLDTLAHDIEALDPPSAGTAILARVELLVGAAWDTDITRMKDLRALREDAAKRLALARDDISLAQAQLGIAWDTLTFDNDLDRAQTQIDRAEQTIARAGRPIRAVQQLASLQGDLALRRGNLDDALAHYRRAVEIARSEETFPYDVMHPYIATLARAGRLAEARTEAEGWIADLEKHYGAGHWSLGSPHVNLAMVLQLAGDLEGALAHQRLSAAHYAKQHDMLDNRAAWGRLYITDLELQLGRADPARALDTIRGIAGLGTTPALGNPDGPSTARRAGLWAAFVHGVEHGTAADGDITEDAIVLAFHRGELRQKDAAFVAAACARAGTCAKTIRFSRWIAEDAPYDELEAEYGHNAYAIANTGILLAYRGAWREALAKLEAARAVPDVWEYQADLADLDAWLGLARLQHGDFRGARQALEESLMVLSISFDGFDGFTYTRPMAELALADIVWNAKDHERAVRLAQSARAGFLRLSRTSDVARAQAWLSTHATQ